MGTREDVEDGVRHEITDPLMRESKLVPNENASLTALKNSGHPWMVYLGTLVAVCGSYEFGACVSPYLSTGFSTTIQKEKSLKSLFFYCFSVLQAGYSSPVQDEIIEDLNLSLAEVSL